MQAFYFPLEFASLKYIRLVFAPEKNILLTEERPSLNESCVLFLKLNPETAMSFHHKLQTISLLAWLVFCSLIGFRKKRLFGATSSPEEC